jgi:hypothetical protein
MPNNNIPITVTYINHYNGPATVISHFPRITKENKEVLKVRLKLHKDFLDISTNKVSKNNIVMCTVYGERSNYVEYMKRLKKGDLIHVQLDYEYTKNQYHDYIIRDSTLVNPAFEIDKKTDNDTLGNWM